MQERNSSTDAAPRSCSQPPSTMAALTTILHEVEYVTEKGAPLVHDVLFDNANLNADRIRDFLTKYKNQEKDLALNFANIGIDDPRDGIPAEIRGLKYMAHLVRVFVPFDASNTRLHLPATDSKQGRTNDHHRAG